MCAIVQNDDLEGLLFSRSVLIFVFILSKACGIQKVSEFNAPSECLLRIRFANEPFIGRKCAGHLVSIWETRFVLTGAHCFFKPPPVLPLPFNNQSINKPKISVAPNGEIKEAEWDSEASPINDNGVKDTGGEHLDFSLGISIENGVNKSPVTTSQPFVTVAPAYNIKDGLYRVRRSSEQQRSLQTNKDTKTAPKALSPLVASTTTGEMARKLDASVKHSVKPKKPSKTDKISKAKKQPYYSWFNILRWTEKNRAKQWRGANDTLFPRQRFMGSVYIMCAVEEMIFSKQIKIDSTAENDAVMIHPAYNPDLEFDAADVAVIAMSNGCLKHGEPVTSNWEFRSLPDFIPSLPATGTDCQVVGWSRFAGDARPDCAVALMSKKISAMRCHEVFSSANTGTATALPFCTRMVEPETNAIAGARCFTKNCQYATAPLVICADGPNSDTWQIVGVGRQSKAGHQFDMHVSFAEAAVWQFLEKAAVFAPQDVPCLRHPNERV